MHAIRLTLAIPSVALLTLAACDGSPSRMRSGRDGGTAIASDAFVAPGLDAPAPSMRIEVGPLPPDPMLDALDRTRDPSCPASARWVVAVRGRVVDEGGAPIADAYVQPCLRLGGTDRLVCLRPSTSDAEGVVTAILPEGNRCVDEVALRMLVPETSLATSYCAVTEPAEDAVLVSSRALVLVDTSAPRVRPPVGDEGAMREVAFDGLSLTTAPRMIGAESYDAMGARIVPGSLATDACLGDGTAMDLLVAFSPEAPVDDGAGLAARIEARGFAPGETVELHVLGGLATMLSDGELVPEAEWHEFATATVAADGTIATPGGRGVPHLGWLGLRRAR